MKRTITILPSILETDPAQLAYKLDALSALFAVIQLDVADGAFVPATTVQPNEWPALPTEIEYEAHLMTKEEKIDLPLLKTKGVKRVIAHLEALQNPKKFLDEVKATGLIGGLALNPETRPEALGPYLNDSAIVLVMGVEPGEQGQAFLPETLVKIQELKKINARALIEVDGGINHKTALEAVGAGANILNVGSYLFNQESPTVALHQLGTSLKQEGYVVIPPT